MKNDGYVLLSPGEVMELMIHLDAAAYMTDKTEHPELHETVDRILDILMGRDNDYDEAGQVLERGRGQEAGEEATGQAPVVLVDAASERLWANGDCGY